MVANKRDILTKNYPIAETLCLCRVSSDKQERNGNIISQKQACLNKAKENDVKINKFYDEDGVSAWKGERPVLWEIAERIQKNFNKGKRTRLIAFDFSRLSRNMLNYAKLEQILVKCRAEILLVRGKYDTSAAGRKGAFQAIVDAQAASDEQSEKVVFAKKALAQLGFYTNNPPVGLKRERDSENRVILVHDEPRAGLILQAFERFASGELPTKISVAEFLRQYPLWGKKTITDTTIKNIFENEIYTGEFAYPRYDITRQKWKIDPLISHDLFARVQKRMVRGKRSDYKSNTLEQFPLRGKVCCECCGMPLTAQMTKGRNGHHAHYHCFRKGCALKGKTIRRADLESAFESRIESMKAETTVLDLFAKVMRENGTTKDASNAISRKRLLDKIAEAQKEIESFGTLIVKSLQDDKESMIKAYEGLIESATENKQKFQSELDKIPNSLVDMEKFQTALERGRDFFQNPYLLWKKGTVSQKRRLIHTIFQDKPTYYRENGFQTAGTLWIFNEKPRQNDAESILVGVTGFEPVQA